MPFTESDPRSALDPGAGAQPRSAEVAAPAQYFSFGVRPDEVTAAGSRSWYRRGQNFILRYVEAASGDRFARTQPDESVIIVPAGGAVLDVTSGDTTVTHPRPAVIVVPPGPVSVRATSPGTFVHLVTTEAADLLDLCANSAAYAERHAHVAPLSPWPEPADGYRLRVYDVANAPDDGQRFGRIYRCRTFMVNYLYPSEGPRDPANLSPHAHDDFEQCSLTLEGDFVHHIRTPWTSRLDEWRPDDHEPLASPGMVVIPPPTIHTSQAVGAGTHQLVDIFCPPRADFSARPGWVLNEREYPVAE